MPSGVAFYSHFGSWKKALKAAKLQPIKIKPSGRSKGITNSTYKRVEARGYWAIKDPAHPCANKNGYVLEHRKIAYDAGILVDLSMDVHHINHDKKDNRLENLQVLTPGEHHSLHGLQEPHPKFIRAESRCWFKSCRQIVDSKYGLCGHHYREQWSRKKHGMIKDIMEYPSYIDLVSANKIRNFRDSQKLSQLQFSKFIGVSQRTIASWEVEETKPSRMAQNFLKILYANPELLEQYNGA